MKLLCTTAALFFMVPAVAAAQSSDHRYRGQGYVFLGLDPDCNGVYFCNVMWHIGGGGEGFLYKGLGAGIEVAGGARRGTEVLGKTRCKSAIFWITIRPRSACLRDSSIAM
jgi:hypothetical protein